MSQETQIGSLGGGISEEDSKLVDSILNDLNGQQGERQQQEAQQQSHEQHHEQQQRQQQRQQQQMPRDQNGNELTPEQIKQIQMQRQLAMQQQQLMAQQQQMQQQMGQAQNIDKEETKSNLIPSDKNDLLDNIKNESKSIILVILLSIIFNLEQVDNLFKLQSGLFISENGSLNMQAIFVKALAIGSIYYVVKLYLL